MRRWLCLLPALCSPLVGVIVDRIAIAVGNKVITESAIVLRIRLTAFENDESPDFSLASRKATADRLVDQRIVEREMDVGHYTRLGDAERARLLDDYARSNFRSDRNALRRALAASQLTEADLQEDLARQSDLLNFVNLRFRPAVQVSDQDVRQFFDSHAMGNMTLADLRSQIEQRLAWDRADADMASWLHRQRAALRIEYLDKDLAP